MNWVWPMAPAHDPFSRDRGCSPDWMILSVAISSPSAKARRRPWAARVAKARTTSKSPWIAPKPLSMAQMPSRISRGTPNRSSIGPNSGIAARRRWPLATRSGLVVPFT